MTPRQFADRASALAGAPFRLGGRDVSTGIDCVGVIALAAGRPELAPGGYALRNSAIDHLLPALDHAGFVAVDPKRPVARGDVLLFAAGPAQHHLAVALERGRFVHAHAGLRRTVIQPGPFPWPIIARWRLADTKD